jgi:hypothetical protein
LCILFICGGIKHNMSQPNGGTESSTAADDEKRKRRIAAAERARQAKLKRRIDQATKVLQTVGSNSVPETPKANESKTYTEENTVEPKPQQDTPREPPSRNVEQKSISVLDSPSRSTVTAPRARAMSTPIVPSIDDVLASFAQPGAAPATVFPRDYVRPWAPSNVKKPEAINSYSQAAGFFGYNLLTMLIGAGAVAAGGACIMRYAPVISEKLITSRLRTAEDNTAAPPTTDNVRPSHPTVAPSSWSSYLARQR